jgi:alpha-tubulin suppressor-like RCC1 family protein
MHGSNMRSIPKALFLSFLMIVLSFSAAISSLNESTELTDLEPLDEPLYTILPIADLNVSGFQEGSIFTDATLSSGHRHTCMILDNGSVSCWGDNTNGALGRPNPSSGWNFITTTPVLTSSFGAGRTAVAISAGGAHTCAILDNGSVSCWGDGGYGRLGNGGTSKQFTPTLTSSLGQGRTAVAISAGASHTCAILDNGSVSCWGYGSYGRLGNGGTSNQLTPTLTSSLGQGRTAVAISAGSSHTCALLDNGLVSCWGYGGSGQLGTHTIDELTPTLSGSLGNGRTAIALSSGSYHTCAILDNGSVSCWGGIAGTDGAYATPTLTGSLGVGRTAIALSSGYRFSCVILDNGSVSCWGEGDKGQIGNGFTSDQTTPTLTSSLGAGRTAVALASNDEHTCSILDDGLVSCWGYGGYGQLGNGGQTYSQTTPTLTSSFGTNSTAALSERDFNGNGVLNIFEQTPPSLVDCSVGQYGYYMCVDAPSGKYVPSSSARYATDCSAGTYNPNTGSTASTDCLDADAGYYVNLSAGISQSNQTACPAGTYNPNTGSTASTDCLDADAGYYVNQTGQNSQTACSAGTYNPNIGSTASTDCLDADAGYYVDLSSGTAQSNQTACSAGTYNPNIGSNASTDCLDADAGYYVELSSGIGQSNQTACSAGTYNPNIGSTVSTDCLDADAGFYVPTTGQSSQTQCPVGETTITTGSTAVNQCLPDFDGDNTVDDLDTDDDGDGVLDSIDQCLTADLNLTADNDGDGCDDADEDTDDDNDGILDVNDAFPLDSSESVDTDDDGTGDNADTDDDGDNVPDADDAFPLDPTESIDTDNDGTGDNADTDDDDDSVLDSDDAFPLDPTESEDTDNDGTGDNADTDDDGDDVDDSDDAFPLDSSESVDTDNDGTGDNADTDDDGDDVDDSEDAFPLDPTESEDTDNDGTGDNVDTDDDGDNVTDADDAFPLDSSESVDTDNDGTGDNADTDDDGDNVLDADDAFPLDSTKSKDTVSDEDSSIPGFTGILATLSLLSAAFIRRNE